MKLVTYQTASLPARLGVVQHGLVHDLCAAAAARGDRLPRTMRGLLSLGAEGLDMARQAAHFAAAHRLPAIPEAEATFLAPLGDPPKILCLAGNYQAHIQEGGLKAVEKARITPRVFMKPITTLCGNGAPILLPEVSKHVDYELELAVVIGKAGHLIPAADALSHVAGYAVYNDISSRRLVIAEGRDARDGDGFFDWLAGKWQDNSGPMGPYLVTADEVPDVSTLGMRLFVNGEKRQDALAGQMIFDVAETIAFCSRLVTLQVGDIIATGTPSGVGDAKGVYLKAGDVVRCEIDGLGVLENPVRAA